MNYESIDLHNLSEEAFAALGTENTVYIKPVVEDGVCAFTVHSALGQPVGVMASKEEALMAAFAYDMDVVSLH